MDQLRPAAQYVRMSTEHQRYSPENQRQALKAYAEEHGYSIVKEYMDYGKSGLSLHGRTGLKQLLADALEGLASFSTILVLDVSRWGRFQDPDQAAHYEFLCRQAGVSIEYCLEPFTNDGAPLSALAKSIKRVMASEYSRDLSARVKAGCMSSAMRGFKQGGGAPYGLRRAILDRNGAPLVVLEHGERSQISGRGAVLIRGPLKEIETVRRIFLLYVKERRPLATIARQVNSEGRRDTTGEPFSADRIRHILHLELYTGTYSYNKSSKILQRSLVKNSRELWVRSKMFKPIISQYIFSAAQRRVKQRPASHHTAQQLIDHLRTLLHKYGKLSQRIISANAPPTRNAYAQRFGSLARAYELVGYTGNNARFLARRPRVYTDDQLLDRLRRTLARDGYLSRRLIDLDPDLPSSALYTLRFGSLKNAYARAGWNMTQVELTDAGRNRRSKALGEISATRQLERSTNSSARTRRRRLDKPSPTP